jgi:hypothetical protein
MATNIISDAMTTYVAPNYLAANWSALYKSTDGSTWTTSTVGGNNNWALVSNASNATMSNATRAIAAGGNGKIQSTP